jgi:hypothetical protein
MALNDDWVADVRRWYFDERDARETPAQLLAQQLSEAPQPIGYEAALPALQLEPGELDRAIGQAAVP